MLLRTVSLSAMLFAASTMALPAGVDPGPSTFVESFNEGLIKGLGGDTSDYSYKRGFTNGYVQGLLDGANEGFLNTYGELTGETPGPVVQSNSSRTSIELEYLSKGRNGVSGSVRPSILPDVYQDIYVDPLELGGSTF